MNRFCIVQHLPSNEDLKVIELNYYRCHVSDISSQAEFIDWDTDRGYAMIFESEQVCHHFIDKFIPDDTHKVYIRPFTFELVSTNIIFAGSNYKVSEVVSFGHKVNGHNFNKS